MSRVGAVSDLRTRAVVKAPPPSSTGHNYPGGGNDLGNSPYGSGDLDPAPVGRPRFPFYAGERARPPHPERRRLRQQLDAGPRVLGNRGTAIPPLGAGAIRAADGNANEPQRGPQDLCRW